MEHTISKKYKLINKCNRMRVMFFLLSLWVGNFKRWCYKILLPSETHCSPCQPTFHSQGFSPVLKQSLPPTAVFLHSCSATRPEVIPMNSRKEKNNTSLTMKPTEAPSSLEQPCAPNNPNLDPFDIPSIAALPSPGPFYCQLLINMTFT